LVKEIIESGKVNVGFRVPGAGAAVYAHLKLCAAQRKPQVQLVIGGPGKVSITPPGP